MGIIQDNKCLLSQTKVISVYNVGTFMDTKQLRRSSTNKVIAGVCGGLGEYFEVDPSVVRIVFVLLTFFGASGILLYLILWIILPASPTIDPLSHEGFNQTVAEMKSKAHEVVNGMRPNSTPVTPQQNQSWIAILLVALGALFLFRNFGVFDIFDFDRMWPVALVVLGLALLFRRK